MSENQYYLMHKDIITGIVTINKEFGTAESVAIIDQYHAPIGCNNKKAFFNWWERRAIPKHQKNQEILLNGETNLVYMMENLGLSLTDCYWIKPVDSAFEWKDVNLYEHNFAEKDFHYQDLENVSPFKPSATTQGELQKRWVIIDNERYLIKGNYSDMYRQSINEVLASNVHQMQGVDHTEYKKISLPTTMGNGIGCISKNFTSPALEFVPAYDISYYDKQPNDKSIFQHYVDTCIKLGIPEDIMKKSISYMILSDFLLTNIDRHLLNCGILRNPDTLEFIKPAPLFDTGNSMFYNRKYDPNTILNIPITSFYKTETKFLEMVKDPLCFDLNKIPCVSDLYELYKDDPYSIVYFDNMKEGYEKKIELLDAFQRGYSLNPRSSNFYQNKKEEQEEQEM